MHAVTHAELAAVSVGSADTRGLFLATLWVTGQAYPILLPWLLLQDMLHGIM